MLRPAMLPNMSQGDRRSLRLREYDYGATGAYFVTVCTKGRLSLFGEIDLGNMVLNELGEIVAAIWSDLPHHFPNIQLDSFIVMPNHLHGLIEITDEFCANPVGAQHAAPDPSAPMLHARRNVQPGSLAAIVHLQSYTAAPYQSLHWHAGCNNWQRNYYEHVVRDEPELQRVREYIVNNPAQWAEDEENPEVVRSVGLRLKG